MPQRVKDRYPPCATDQRFSISLALTIVIPTVLKL